MKKSIVLFLVLAVFVSIGQVSHPTKTEARSAPDSYFLFTDEEVRLSEQPFGVDYAYRYNSIPLCYDSIDSAVIARDPLATEGVIIDNYITVNGHKPCGSECFSGTTGVPAVVGHPIDEVLLPIPPISVGNILAPDGTNVFELRDWGVIYGNTSLWLVVTGTPCVTYTWTGFFQPVDNGVLNKAKAGSAIPVKFSLGGNFGLDIFESGYPTATTFACSSTDGVEVEETVTAGASSLSYDAASDQYIYIWKTDKEWAGKCATLSVQLNDGTTHTAEFTFTR